MPDSDTEIEPKRYLTLKLSSKDIKILNTIYNAKKHLSMSKTKKIKKNIKNNKNNKEKEFKQK
jgi:hypothetical protein